MGQDRFFPSQWLIGIFLNYFCVALEPVLALVLLKRLASNSQKSAYLCLPSAEMKGVWHHCLELFLSFSFSVCV